MALEYVTYACAAFIWAVYFRRLWLVLAVLLAFQLIAGLTADPPLPLAETGFWVWRTLTGVVGASAGLGLGWALGSPAILTLAALEAPAHFVWTVIQLLGWHAALVPMELLPRLWGAIMTTGLFVVWTYVCKELCKLHGVVFKQPEHADITLFWTAVTMILTLELPIVVMTALIGVWAFWGVLVGAFLSAALIAFIRFNFKEYKPPTPQPAAYMQGSTAWPPTATTTPYP